MKIACVYALPPGRVLWRIRISGAVSVWVLLLLSVASGARAYDEEAWTSFPNQNHVTALAEGDNVVYIGTTGGIRRFDRFSRTFQKSLTVLDGLPDNRIRSLAYDRSTGDLWFGTARGDGRWLSRLEIVSLAGRPPSGLGVPSSPARIPQVFPPFGYYLDQDRVRGPRRDYRITDVLLDSWGDLWVGTWGLGVGRADMRDNQLTFHASGPLDENVTAVARDGDWIWFAGDDTYDSPARGITRHRLGTDVWEYFEADQVIGIDDPRITAILPDSANVWFGTRRGLTRYHRETGRWLTYRASRRWGPVTALARDHGRLWVGTEIGLAVLDVPADSLRFVGGSERFRIYALARGETQVWAGTEFGVYHCPSGDVTWRSAGLTRSRILALFARGREIWAAAESPPGLIRFAHGDTTTAEYPLTEIGAARRTSVAADSTRVWIATESGAFRLRSDTGMWKRFWTTDGIIDDLVQAVCLEGEYVWFGTRRGASRYHLASDFFERDPD